MFSFIRWGLDSDKLHFAGIGYTYDSNLDAFIAPKPFNSWLLDTETCKWEAPIEQPEGDYTWNEIDLSWDKIEIG